MPGYQVDRNAPWLIIEKSVENPLDSDALIMRLVIKFAMEFYSSFTLSNNN